MNDESGCEAVGLAGPNVELRVHGVHGTPAEIMLGDPFPRQVAGDDNAQFFQASEPTRPEQAHYVREAFEWSRFTSGSATRAFWLLFLPFTLVNLSRYTILSWDDQWDSAQRQGFARPCLWGVDAALRLLGLIMTMSLLTTSVYAAAELVAHRCILTPACTDVETHWLAFARGWSPGAALLLALAPPVLVLGIVFFMGTRSNLLGTVEPTKWMTERRFGSKEFWHEAKEVAVLRQTHFSGCCALLGIFYANFDVQADSWSFMAWVPPAIGGLVLLGVVFLTLNSSVLNTKYGRISVAISVSYAVISCSRTVLDLWDSRSFIVLGDVTKDAPALPGLEVANQALLLAAVLVLAYLGILTCWFRRSFNKRDLENGARPSSFSPLLKGWAMPAIAIVGVGLFYGLTTGLTYRLADLVGTPGIERVTVDHKDNEVVVPLSTSYVTGASTTVIVAGLVVAVALPLVGRVVQRRYVARLYVAGILAALVAALFWANSRAILGLLAATTAVALIAAAIWRLTQVGSSLDAPIRADYPSDSPDRPGLVPSPQEQRAAVATAWRLGQAKYRYSDVVTVLAWASVLGILLTAAAAVWRVGSADRPPPTLEHILDILSGVGGWVATSLFAALLFVGVRTFQSPTMRTATGIAWDLLSFWPRIAHPLCPPPYGGRAVLELADRVRTLEESEESAVLLSAHSQGSVLCAATVMTLAAETRANGEPVLDRVGMVTYGSQLQWAYSRLFPCFLGFRHLEVIHTALNQHWRSIYRETDPLGGPVLTWHEGVRPEVTPDAVREGRCGYDGLALPPKRVDGAVQHGHDIRLLDPIGLGRQSDRPVQPTLGHGDYYAVEAFDNVVDDVFRLIRRV